MKTRVIAAVLVLGAVAGFGWFVGSSNPETPAGYVGYLTQGAVLGRSRFYGLQTGPTSPGRTWLLTVTNVSVTPYTYTEEFAGTDAVLSRDNLRIAFRVHMIWRVRRDRVQEFVERYTTLYHDRAPDKIVVDAYRNFLREPLRMYARDEIQRLNGLEIKDQITPVGQRIHDRIVALSRETPFEAASVVVGNVQYPEEVANAVALKLAATQVLERKRTEYLIEEQEKAKRIVQAEGIARAMAIINERLTPVYLQHEAIEAQKAMVGSPNHTTVYIPVGPMGVPLVGALDTGVRTPTGPAK